MSRMKDLLASKLPAGLTIPEPLDRAWTWMEEQGWGRGEGEDYYLTPYAGDRQMGIVFSTDRTLEGWFEPDQPGYDRLMPLAEISGDGGIGLLWLADNGEVAFAGLGMFGPFLLASDAVDFLRLIAIGKQELISMLLETEAEDEEAAAHAEFRAWVTSEFGVEVPASWTPVTNPDPFRAWVERVQS